MTKLEVAIIGEGAAFEDHAPEVMAQMLEAIANDIRAGHTAAVIRDINGNRVGYYLVEVAS